MQKGGHSCGIPAIPLCLCLVGRNSFWAISTLLHFTNCSSCFERSVCEACWYYLSNSGTSHTTHLWYPHTTHLWHLPHHTPHTTHLWHLPHHTLVAPPTPYTPHHTIVAPPTAYTCGYPPSKFGLSLLGGGVAIVRCREGVCVYTMANTAHTHTPYTYMYTDQTTLNCTDRRMGVI